MFKYTQSAILNTFHLIKKIIFISVIIIQVGYIAYISFRLSYNMGIFIINIILLSISILYLIYYVATYQEFYTEEHKKNRLLVKWVFKSIKYAASAYLLVIAILELISNNENNNIAVLVIVLMILSILFSIIFDLIVILIDQQVVIINNSLRYDMELFRENNKFFAGGIKRMGFNIEEKFPVVENDKIRQKIIDINYDQEQKKLRKKRFLKKYK